ncbi:MULTISPECIES: helix-turn-helix domain-containing protein [Achromobacter]|uniref:helix-turn-helix domain-containing protein n=1 Tax=Achromobacter TaxID=222 RepID=UPI001467D8D2|nr:MULTISPECIES: helix-turn-helix domain-containing protein [Achromobacter]MCG7326885.1 helix-turn-helix domain-containing protein [Achromobacter sp. ACRQX]CAB3865771.1 HTH-type transcriptional activator RhaR [Achromobacter animicus]
MSAGSHSPIPETFPTFESSDFSGEGSFYFDLVRLQDHDDIPRGFLHRHRYYHLLWMTEAQGTHLLDFEQHAVRDHSVFFLSPGQIHAWTSSVKPSGYVMNISTEFFAQMFPRADDIAKFPFFHMAGGPPVIYLTREQHDAMLPLLAEIERETRDRQTGRFDVVRSYLLILLTQLRRLYPADERETAAGPSYSLAKRFTMLIEEHYLDFSAIRQYADALCVSERQLNDAVKRSVGRTASQLVQERIALEAKRLLCNTDLSIAEIGFQLNIEDPAYFTRFFKKHTGCTPGDFRKKYYRPIE